MQKHIENTIIYSMKKISILTFFSILFCAVGLYAQSSTETARISLVFDYDLKFRAAYYSNVDYSTSNISSQNIFSQYLSLNFIGKFEDRIEMAAKIGSYGISGKSNPVFLMPYDTDEKNGYKAFIETAFLTFKSENSAAIPYVFYVGKQDLTAGDGFIVDGNNNGMLGVRGKGDFFKFFTLDLFAAKDEKVDFDLYGGSVKIKTSPVIEFGIYQERNNTEHLYKKGIENKDINIRFENKTFYDFRITGTDKSKKYKYRIEFAKQTGELVKTYVDTDTVKYDAFALVLEGSWSGKLLKADSNAKLLFSYANADGENHFNPTFSKRYNGIGQTGYGMLFAANNTDSFIKLPNGYYGINTLGFEFDTMPLNFLQTGLGFYLFSASDALAEAGSAGIGELYGAKADLGNEIDLFVKYKYKNYFDAAVNFAMYTPPADSKLFLNTDKSFLVLFEVSARF